MNLEQQIETLRAAGLYVSIKTRSEMESAGAASPRRYTVVVGESEPFDAATIAEGIRFCMNALLAVADKEIAEATGRGDGLKTIAKLAELAPS